MDSKLKKIWPKIDIKIDVILDRPSERLWLTLGVFLAPWTLENECFVCARCSFSKSRILRAWAVFFFDFVTFGMLWGAILTPKVEPK